MIAITQPQLHILRHALGIDTHGNGKEYRNHFCTGEGNHDHRLCMELVAAGWMLHKPGSDLTGGDDLFVVTEAGKTLVRGLKPPSNRRRREQEVYARWQASGTGVPFKEWVKNHRRNAA